MAAPREPPRNPVGRNASGELPKTVGVALAELQARRDARRQEQGLSRAAVLREPPRAAVLRESPRAAVLRGLQDEQHLRGQPRQPADEALLGAEFERKPRAAERALAPHPPVALLPEGLLQFAAPPGERRPRARLANPRGQLAWERWGCLFEAVLALCVQADGPALARGFVRRRELRAHWADELCESAAREVAAGVARVLRPPCCPGAGNARRLQVRPRLAPARRCLVLPSVLSRRSLHLTPFIAHFTEYLVAGAIQIVEPAEIAL